jgi:hypothetical protein
VGNSLKAVHRRLYRVLDQGLYKGLKSHLKGGFKMWKISEEAVKKFYEKKNFRRGNTEVLRDEDTVLLLLHGHAIAKMENELFVRSFGWFTKTTKNRLNALLGKFGIAIRQEKYTWYFTNGTKKVSYETLAGNKCYYIDGNKWLALTDILDALSSTN